MFTKLTRKTNFTKSSGHRILCTDSDTNEAIEVRVYDEFYTSICISRRRSPIPPIRSVSINFDLIFRPTRDTAAAHPPTTRKSQPREDYTRSTAIGTWPGKRVRSRRPIRRTNERGRKRRNPTAARETDYRALLFGLRTRRTETVRPRYLCPHNIVVADRTPLSPADAVGSGLLSDGDSPALSASRLLIIGGRRGVGGVGLDYDGLHYVYSWDDAVTISRSGLPWNFRGRYLRARVGKPNARAFKKRVTSRRWSAAPGSSGARKAEAAVFVSSLRKTTIRDELGEPNVCTRRIQKSSVLSARNRFEIFIALTLRSWYRNVNVQIGLYDFGRVITNKRKRTKTTMYKCLIDWLIITTFWTTSREKFYRATYITPAPPHAIFGVFPTHGFSMSFVWICMSFELYKLNSVCEFQ